jgi:RNA polymerase sigma-70 factor (ECF subfamily)
VDDAQHFDDFYREGYARLAAAVGLLTGSRAEAEDAVDEALARAWTRLQRGDEIEALGAWVRVVALPRRGGRARHAHRHRALTAPRVPASEDGL